MDTDENHPFEPLAGDDVCMYVLSNGNQCMKFEGEHGSGLPELATKAQGLYLDYMAKDGEDDDEKWAFIDAALVVLEKITGQNVAEMAVKGVDST